jgi:tRNA modification GTPase
LFSGKGDTIFAPASGASRAAIAVFRVSGARSFEALRSLAPGPEVRPRAAVVRKLRYPNTLEVIDKALIIRFERPYSFTGEDLLELHVTGGRAVSRAALEALGQVHGLRPAEPGEFAWRAFANGKIDLSEVEGLAQLVEAETEAQRRQAQRIAGGSLRRECEAIRAMIIEAMAIVEAQIDFSDVEGAEIWTLNTVHDNVRAASELIGKALRNSLAADRLRTGFTVVIAGPPNVGKSTLMNVLAGRDVAITSPLAGTTRDLIEVFLDLRGYPVMLVDSAGIRASDDPVESEGIRRALQRAESADLTLWLSDDDAEAAPPVRGLVFRVRAKIDLLGSEPAPRSGSDFAISAVTGEGIDELLEAIADRAAEQMSGSEPALLIAERHRRAFRKAKSALDSVLSPERTDLEIVAEELRNAAAALDSVVGRIGVDQVLGEIFSRLCVGK